METFAPERFLQQEAERLIGWNSLGKLTYVVDQRSV